MHRDGDGPAGFALVHQHMMAADDAIEREATAL